jgi:hypothetical protein
LVVDVSGRGLKKFDDFGLDEWNALSSDDGLLNCLKALAETAKGLLSVKDMVTVSSTEGSGGEGNLSWDGKRERRWRMAAQA